MGLITKEVEVCWTPSNRNHYEDLGYSYIWRGKFIIPTEYLLNNSCMKVDVECDDCGKELKNIVWQAYKKGVKKDGKYYCKSCAMRLYGRENLRLSLLVKNGNSFEQWCINNNKLEELNRWDYELNNCTPSEIGYATNSKFYFKCNNNIHPSELKKISSFTSKTQGITKIDCKACNSFAQWGINNVDKDFLDKYWDYEKNTINPWNIDRGSSSKNKKVWIKCQENNNHNSYSTICLNFYNGSRCPECNESKGEKQLDIILSKYNIPHDSQYIFDDLIGINNGLLRFDTPIFWDEEKTSLRMLVEYDGEQHFEWIKGMMTKKKFETLQYHDKLKNEYCKKHNIILLRIPYWDFDNIETILRKELNLQEVVAI